MSIGGAATSLTIGGTTTASTTLNIATNVTGTGTKTVNIGTGGGASSTNVVNIGSSVSGAINNLIINGLTLDNADTQIVTRDAATGKINYSDTASANIVNYGMVYAMSSFNYLP